MKSTKLPAITGLLGSILLASPGFAQSGARIECFAPGMRSPVLITNVGGTASVNLGEPFRYEIWGVSGSLTLGTQAVGAAVKTNDPFQRFFANKGGNNVQSHSWVKLQVNSEMFYPSMLAVQSNAVATTGNLRLNGDHWITSQRHKVNSVNLTFHLAGTTSDLRTPYPNSNPQGYFYVLGEYMAVPPPPTGTLVASPKSVAAGTTTGLTWQIFRAGSASNYGCTQCAPTGAQTIIGTPTVTGTAVGSTDGKDNNGHGNNLDGVDCSNPGQGNGGPNGAIDLSGSVDDEAKGFRRLSR